MIEARSEWDNPEHTVILQTLSGNWTWDHYNAMVAAADEMMLSVDHLVDFIIDMRESGPLPMGIIHYVQRVFTKGPSNWGLVIFVEPTFLVRSFIKTFQTVYPRIGESARITDTVAAARTLCQEAQAARAAEVSRP